MTEKRNILKDLFSKQMLIVFLLGFASGLPLLLTGGTLKTWLAREHVDISTIGYFSWVGMAYSLKFLWSPLLDRFTLFKIGRRRSWMLVTQALLMASIYYLGTLNPLQNLTTMAAMAVLIAFFSATQDIAIDAYRRELLSNEELGLGSSLGIYGYRIALLLSGGAGIGLVGSEIWPITWGQLYYIMAGCMIVGVLTTLFAPEPKVDSPPPRTLMEAIVDPFSEFLRRPGAWFILLFVFMFKLGDALSGALLNPFYVEMGFSNADIGLIAKTFGLMSSLVGLFFGGLVIYYIGIYRSLWIFGVLQGLSTAAFALLTHTGPQAWALATVVVFEDVSSGMGSAAFVAFLGALSNKKYTATQYAILSSIATLGRNFFSGFTGDMVKSLGWGPFFYVCALIAIPGLFMLIGMRKYQTAETV
ncbi:MAG: AmpG family muropeptide MFS transporter [Bdellovibrio sp.]|uniref:AmpG family muropeptide MFS transporter n=1 Tax=Bdellovibrio sp. TaxID=28201 RepID=UPI0039E510E6|nr:AmpG family muropeptide MFS transporter [Bdellovibrio sp.]